jgi:hypothetical protein
MYSLNSTAEAVGFPIQKSPDQNRLGGSPKLIAAYHVFRRLLVPRHPPCALSSLYSPSTLHLAISCIKITYTATPRVELKKENLHELNSFYSIS